MIVPFIGKSTTSKKSFSNSNKSNWVKYPSSFKQSANELSKNKVALKLNIESELIQQKVIVDQLGAKHYSYQQSYKGIPVEGAIYKIHEHSNNEVYASNGKLVNDLNLTSQPALTPEDAVNTALITINSNLYGWQVESVEQTLKQSTGKSNATFYPNAELVIYNPSRDTVATNYKLAYKIDVYSVEPLSRKLIFIDAQTAEVLGEEEKIKSCFEQQHTGTTNYSGTVSFTACDISATDEFFDFPNALKNQLGGGIQVFNAKNEQNFVENPYYYASGFFNEDPTATDVFWATQKTYEYFLNTHDRDGIDDNNLPMYSWVHYSDDFANAFWNGNWMTYGDGDEDTYSFTSPDIVAHEIMHGITDYTAALVYQYESGALSEGFSDIFGKVVEFYVSLNEPNWIIGDIFKSTAIKDGLRDMSNPKNELMYNVQPDTYLGENWYYGNDDFGGVHINGGVLNYWFYLLSEGGGGINDNGHAYNISSIGMEAAANIAYKALTTYLTPESEYLDARDATVQSAMELYGGDSFEHLQTSAAWCAVGLGTCAANACRNQDSLTLVKLYNFTDGANWSNPWVLSQSIDQWTGITLNENGCVTAIELEGNNLQGSLPVELGNMSSLEVLNLSNNILSDNIPESLCNLEKLQILNLSSNILSGTIPSNLPNLEEVKTIDFSENELFSSIPNNLIKLNAIEKLYLNDNLLSGSIVPEYFGFGDLNSLKELNLSNNQLSGLLPEMFGELGNLEYINLSNNDFYGCFDANLLNLCNSLLPIYNTNEFISDNNLFGNTWENFCNNGDATCNCRYTDSLALIQLYNATNGPNWLNAWDITQPIDTWYGLTLNSNGCVSQINLSENSLSGVIPAEISYLKNLTDLNLSKNQLLGNMPHLVGDMSNLQYLNLSNNLLVGTIPIEIGLLYNLIELRLNDNNFTGAIPIELANLEYLKVLNLSENNFYIPLPCELAELNNLTELRIADCNIPGSIPEEFAQMDSLITLSLSGNQLTGNIPTSFGTFKSLTNLFLDNNLLTGSIPIELTNIGTLDNLILSTNNLEGCYQPELLNLCNQLSSYNISVGNNFSATWDDFCNTGVGSCTPISCYESDSLNLVALYYALEGANWTETWDIFQPIDNWIGVTRNSLGCVISIDLSNNNLLGYIPEEIGNFPYLNYLDLSSNQITDTIPNEIGNLSNLNILNLNDNNFVGNIPVEISQLNNLSEFNFANNALTGILPVEISQLQNLEIFNVNSNQLTGNIPFQYGLLQNLKEFQVANNFLDGTLAPQLGYWSNIEFFYIANNNLTGCLPIELWSFCYTLLLQYNNGNYITDGNSFFEGWEGYCGSGEKCQDLVWPGDLNDSGEVTTTDVLYWGLAVGDSSVLVRSGATTDWVGQSALSWNTSTLNTNKKHQDADGNGKIDSLDLQVVIDNFGLTHYEAFSFETNSPLSFEFDLIDFVTANDQTTSTYDIYVVSESGITPNLHGVAFTVDYNDMQVFSSNVILDQSAIQPAASLNIFDEDNNKQHLALTRIDKVNFPCNTPIARIIVITEDLQSGDPFLLTIDNGNSMASNELLTGLKGATINSSDETFSIYGICSTLPIDSVEINVQNSSATISWPAYENAENYIIEYRLQGEVAWENSYNSNNNFVILADLDPCAVYEIQIRSICSESLNSNFTEAISFETEDCNDECLPITGLFSQNVTSQSITLSWDIVPNSSYNLIYKNVESDIWFTYTTEYPLAILNGLPACSNFEWYMEINCPTGLTSSSSQIENFETLGENCRLPSTQLLSELSIYPNPSINYIEVQFKSKNDEAYWASIINSAGTIVQKFDGNIKAGINNLNLNISNFEAGVYHIQIHTENEMLTESFFKQ